MKKLFFLMVSLLALAGCTKTQTISIPSNIVVNPCDAIMHTGGYFYYRSEELKLHFCYLPDINTQITFQESGNKILFNYHYTNTGLAITDDQSSLEILEKDPNTTLNMYLSKRFVGYTCTPSCSKDDSGVELCSILGATQDFIDRGGLTSYHGSCPSEYLANQTYRAFISLPSHPEKIIFNNQVGGDRGPAGVIDSLSFE